MADWEAKGTIHVLRGKDLDALRPMQVFAHIAPGRAILVIKFEPLRYNEQRREIESYGTSYLMATHVV